MESFYKVHLQLAPLATSEMWWTFVTTDELTFTRYYDLKSALGSDFSSVYLVSSFCSRVLCRGPRYTWSRGCPRLLLAMAVPQTPCFWWPWPFWGLLISQFVGYPLICLCLISFLIIRLGVIVTFGHVNINVVLKDRHFLWKAVDGTPSIHPRDKSLRLIWKTDFGYLRYT